jgi:hypothetical protein
MCGSFSSLNQAAEHSTTIYYSSITEAEADEGTLWSVLSVSPAIGSSSSPGQA